MPLSAICSESQPCLNGASCNDSSGTCECKQYYVGVTCGVSVGKKLISVFSYTVIVLHFSLHFSVH